MEFIDNKKFAKTTLDENFKIFVVHIAALKVLKMIIYPLQTTQILSKKLLKVAALKQNKVPIKIPTKYSDFLNVFS